MKYFWLGWMAVSVLALGGLVVCALTLAIIRAMVDYVRRLSAASY